MKTFSGSIVVLAITLVSILGGSTSFAALSITPVGLVDATTQVNWRTTAIAKPLDIDGDNVYGTNGYYAFSTGGGFAGTGPLTGLNGLPSWLSLSANGAVGGFRADYAFIDDPNSPPDNSVSSLNDIHSGIGYRQGVVSGNLYDLTFGANTPAHVIRIGLFENSADTSMASYTLTSGAVSANQPFGAVENDGIVRYVFFDVTGATQGDVITISGTINFTGGTANLGLSGITLDVPEPAAVGLLAVGAMSMLARRRRNTSFVLDTRERNTQMKMFTKSIVFAALTLGLILGGTASFAAPINISAVGLDTTTQADWRTSTMSKPMDYDGDNIYGTAGYYAFATGGGGGDFGGTAFSGEDMNGLPTWFGLSPNGASFHYNGAYDMFDNPSLPTVTPPIADINSGFSWNSGIGANTSANLFNITFGATAPSGLIRIGVIENSGTIGAGTLTLTSGATSATVNVTASPSLRYAFFDITNAPGNTVTISGTIATAGNLGLTALSIDLPEPTGAGVLVAGAMCALVRRRRQTA